MHYSKRKLKAINGAVREIVIFWTSKAMVDFKKLHLIKYSYTHRFLHIIYIFEKSWTDPLNIERLIFSLNLHTFSISLILRLDFADFFWKEMASVRNLIDNGDRMPCKINKGFESHTICIIPAARRSKAVVQGPS